MYQNPPVLLPPISNREDLAISVSIYDDDTGEAINLSATVTASGAPFSGASWVVTVGSVATTSTTPLTIPTPPIGGQLEAVTLTVGAGLPIVQGNAVKIADATGTNYMLGTVTSYTPATGTLTCQIGSTFQFEIRRGPPRNDGSGYIPWYDFGTPDAQGALIKAALGTGITIADLGIIIIAIPETIIRQLATGTFGAYLTAFDGVNTRQIFIASLPVLYGGVTQ